MIAQWRNISHVKSMFFYLGISLKYKKKIMRNFSIFYQRGKLTASKLNCHYEAAN